MASLIYNSFMVDLVHGAIIPATDTVYGMLVTAAYTPNKDTDTKRSNVTNEVVGSGYTAGGQAVAVTCTSDLANDREDITFANNVWPSSSITARAQVLYKHRGGGAGADELYAYVDFLANASSLAGTFTAQCTTPLRLQN